MKIKATISITIEVDGDHVTSILDNDKTSLLMTIFGGNNDKRPELGKWYPEGEYTINEILAGTI